MAKKNKESEYVELGRAAQDLIVKSYGELYSLRRQMWVSFVKGLFTGMGGVIGAVLIAGLLGYLAARFNWLPLIGQWLESLSGAIKDYQPR